MPARALSVARYFLRLAEQEEEPAPLTALHIQKLLYYAQGWSLAIRDTPMFVERIEAWAYGPVVPEVYTKFRSYSRDRISPTESSDEGLTKEQRQFLKCIWQAYKSYSALKLSDMTHEEAPWKITRKGLSREARCERPISHKAMREYFSSLVID